MPIAISHLNFSPLSKLNLHKRPMVMCLMTTQAQNHDYWASIEAQIEAHLKKSIPVRPPIVVFEPMYNLVMAAPKTKAAALCVAASDLVGGDSSSDTVAAASALQLVHAAGVVHEQLPLTDRPCLNPNIMPVMHNYGPNIELLTPDGIVPFAFELVAKTANPARNNSGQVLRVIVEISRAVGSLVDGQWNEIEIWRSEPDGCDDAWVRRVCRKKEGEMHACGAACGAILGGGSEEEIGKLRKYGLYVGLIEGIMNSMGTRYVNKRKLLERVKELGGLALEELEYFKGRNVEPIASFVHANLNDFRKV